ncbi:unnamed protein product [Rotaria magnacalcarata]|uniref:Uncharacterized protein n=1 Tax=Rotaria magnacalcarata TaxID=392030 RepID=A0A8S3HEW2_9BILA|nr:unnamed protein product [Rotaria magnacalcarata]
MPDDTRKTYILSTISNYFGIERDSLSPLVDHRSLNNFFDDAKCQLLSATRGGKHSVDLSNEIKIVEGAQYLVLFKLRPEQITLDNLYTNIFLSSMVDSPIDSLYYMIKSVFSPALRDNTNNINQSNQAANQQIQTSLNELEQVLRSSGKKSSSSSSSSMATISHPKDEIAYWNDMSKNTSSKTKDLERAKYFLQLFDPIKGNFENLEK